MGEHIEYYDNEAMGRWRDGKFESDFDAARKQLPVKTPTVVANERPHYVVQWGDVEALDAALAGLAAFG